MVLTTVLKIDVKTGKEEYVLLDIKAEPAKVEPKGLDFEKLKRVLKEQNIILDFKEVE
jgi:hypothetical protein